MKRLKIDVWFRATGRICLERTLLPPNPRVLTTVPPSLPCRSRVSERGFLRRQPPRARVWRAAGKEAGPQQGR